MQFHPVEGREKDRQTERKKKRGREHRMRDTGQILWEEILNFKFTKKAYQSTKVFIMMLHRRRKKKNPFISLSLCESRIASDPSAEVDPEGSSEGQRRTWRW